MDSDRSRWLPISVDEVTRWLLEEDSLDEYAWEERLRAWIKEGKP